MIYHLCRRELSGLMVGVPRMNNDSRREVGGRMGEAVVYICDTCEKSKASTWGGEPKGWVRLDEAEAKWDGTNYHIFGGKGRKSFCSLKCFIKFMESGQ